MTEENTTIIRLDSQANRLNRFYHSSFRYLSFGTALVAGYLFLLPSISSFGSSILGLLNLRENRSRFEEVQRTLRDIERDLDRLHLSLEDVRNVRADVGQLQNNFNRFRSNLSINRNRR